MPTSVVEIDEKFVLSMLETLSACADAVEMNGPAQYMLAQEVAEIGKPTEDLTLGEVIIALRRAKVRYHRMVGRLRGVSVDPSVV